MFIITNEYTDVSSDNIEFICNELGVSFPVSVESIKADRSFIIDVEL